jgi:hypothetical protein
VITHVDLICIKKGYGNSARYRLYFGAVRAGVLHGAPRLRVRTAESGSSI